MDCSNSNHTFESYRRLKIDVLKYSIYWEYQLGRTVVSGNFQSTRTRSMRGRATHIGSEGYAQKTSRAPLFVAKIRSCAKVHAKKRTTNGTYNGRRCWNPIFVELPARDTTLRPSRSEMKFRKSQKLKRIMRFDIMKASQKKKAEVQCQSW